MQPLPMQFQILLLLLKWLLDKLIHLNFNLWYFDITPVFLIVVLKYCTCFRPVI